MGFSVTHLLVVLAIVTVVFGTKRLRNWAEPFKVFARR